MVSSLGFCAAKCGWRLMVQDCSQAESRAVTMPPVTTRPECGSRRQIFSMYGVILSSRVVMVADSQAVSCSAWTLGAWMNLSGRPKSGSCWAMFFHRLQAPPSGVL